MWIMIISQQNSRAKGHHHRNGQRVVPIERQMACVSERERKRGSQCSSVTSKNKGLLCLEERGAVQNSGGASYEEVEEGKPLC